MQKFTKYLTIFGVTMLISTTWYASSRGFGLDNLTGSRELIDEQKMCPDYQKDRFGNCPPRRHRRSLGARAVYGGGGK
jgi:hypothetical protein